MAQPMDTTVTPCPTCGHPAAKDAYWRTLPTPRTIRRRMAGKCSRCHRAGGTPRQGRAQQVSRELVLEDWRWLHETGELSESQPLAERARIAAPRMGMTPEGLTQALYRAGIRRPTEPAIPRGGVMGCLECRKHNVRVIELQARVSGTARKLATRPDSPRLRDWLAEHQEQLAAEEARRDLHLEYDHDDTEVAA